MVLFLQEKTGKTRIVAWPDNIYEVQSKALCFGLDFFVIDFRWTMKR